MHYFLYKFHFLKTFLVCTFRTVLEGESSRVHSLHRSSLLRNSLTSKFESNWWNHQNVYDFDFLIANCFVDVYHPNDDTAPKGGGCES